MECRRCGNQLPEGSGRCSRCGNEIFAVTAKEKKKKSVIPILIIIFFMCFTATACLIGYRIYEHKLKEAFNNELENIQLSFEKKDYSETLSRLDELKDEKFYKDSLNANLLEGKSALELEDYERATVCFEKASKIKNTEEVVLNLSVCWLMN